MMPDEEWVFRPNSTAQHRFFRSSAPELLISSAYGKGKSRILCEKALWLCMAYPGARVVLARKQRAAMGSTTLRTLLDETLHPEYLRFYVAGADGGSCVFFPNGSQILIAGLDNPGRARSGAFTAAYVDQAEELDEVEWNAIAGRLRWPVGPYRQLGAACNPDSPDHFLYRRFKPQLGTHVTLSESDERLPDGRVIPKGRLRVETITSGATDNYANLPDDYLLRLGRMTGRYRDRYVLGKWVAFEGQVFQGWDPDVHIVDPPPEWAKWDNLPPPDWKRVVGIDFGFENPFVAEWFAISPDERWYRYRELYMSGRTIDEHGRHLLALDDNELQRLKACAKKQGPKCERDHADYLQQLNIVARNSDHDRGEREILANLGVWTTRAEKEIEPGLQTLMRMLDPAQPGGPRALFVRGSAVEQDQRLAELGLPTSLEDEIPGYKWSRRAGGELAGVPKDLPVDKLNHALDAWRYAAHTESVRGKVAVF